MSCLYKLKMVIDCRRDGHCQNGGAMGSSLHAEKQPGLDRTDTENISVGNA